MRTMTVIGVIAALLAAWTLLRSGTGPEDPARGNPLGGAIPQAPPKAPGSGDSTAPVRPARPLETDPFELPIEPDEPPEVTALWEEVFAAGGRLSWGLPGTWTRGGLSQKWHLGPRDLPGGMPTGVRFKRGSLEDQLASVRRFDHWRYVEFNGWKVAAPRAMARWLGTLRSLEGIALRDLLLQDALLLELGGLPSLAHLSLEDSAVPPGSTQHLARLELGHLKLRDSLISDADLQPIGQMTSLQRLDLSGTPISDVGLLFLKELSGLEELELQGTRITGSSLAQLDLPALRVLSCEDSKVDDALLENLRACPHLCALNLNETGIQGSGLRHLARLKALETLELEDTPLEGPYDTFAGLAALPRLRTLKLSDSGVGDSAIPYLLGLTQLTELHVQDSRLTERGIAQLTVGLPTCAVER